MFDFQKTRPPEPRARATWLASGLLHAAIIALVIVVSWRVVPRVTFISLTPTAVPGLTVLPPLGSGAHAGGAVGPKSPAPTTAPAHGTPTPVGPAQAPVSSAPAAVQGLVTTPRLADARIWPAPQAVLPATIGAPTYGPRDTVVRDSAVVRRLKAMVDSLNQVVDDEQRQHKLPSWTKQVGGKKFGLDSSAIYVAGVKIPTATLAALGNMLPQGNFDEALRAHQMDDIRQDIMQAAQRTQTLQDFREYVHELRQRKQEERDFQRNQHSDTTRLVPRDTTRVVP